jgi:hypothetical protein
LQSDVIFLITRIRCKWIWDVYVYIKHKWATHQTDQLYIAMLYCRIPGLEILNL